MKKETRLLLLYVVMAGVLGYLGYKISGDGILGAVIGALLGGLLVKWVSPIARDKKDK